MEIRSPGRDIYSVNFADYLPKTLKQDQKMKALAAAVTEQMLGVSAEIDNVLIYSRIDELPEELIDILAFDMHVDWYDYSYPLAAKRNILKNSVKVHKKMGTKCAVETALSALYSDNKVIEWFEYGGKPYTFRIQVNVTDTYEPIENKNKLVKAINIYKRLTAHLDSIVYFFDILFRVSVKYEMVMRYTSIFYPYHNIPYLYYDGTAQYNGRYQYNKYKTNTWVDLHPVALSITGFNFTNIQYLSKMNIEGVFLLPVHGKVTKLEYKMNINPIIQFDRHKIFIWTSIRNDQLIKYMFQISLFGITVKPPMYSRVAKLQCKSGVNPVIQLDKHQLSIKTESKVKPCRYEIKLTIGYHLTRYDGSCRYDGTRRYDSEIIKERL